MKPARRPNWNHAFFIERTQSERERAPRLEDLPIEIRSRLHVNRAVEIWHEIGAKEVTAASIREHLARLREWERRLR
jgi:hypothetical protein